jgi:hypothetical protein
MALLHRLNRRGRLMRGNLFYNHMAHDGNVHDTAGMAMVMMMMMMMVMVIANRAPLQSEKPASGIRGSITRDKDYYRNDNGAHYFSLDFARRRSISIINLLTSSFVALVESSFSSR